jgi:hypothetical protein
MSFELLPMLHTMLDLYRKPRSIERFREYLATLQGDTKGDMALPISGFNPMAKEHVLHKLEELMALDAERLMQIALADVNAKTKDLLPVAPVRVVLNLADDLHGGWTNRYTTDYDSKFKISALVSRSFCAPYFWTSESFTPDLIQLRTKAYAFRTIYWLTHSRPKTLKEHVAQEAFVAKNAGATHLYQISAEHLREFYEIHQQEDNYNVIFNFLYGDDACISLGFPIFGNPENTSGFDFAASLAISV